MRTPCTIRSAGEPSTGWATNSEESAAHRYQTELASTISSSMRPRARSGASARSPERTGERSGAEAGEGPGGTGWCAPEAGPLDAGPPEGSRLAMTHLLSSCGVRPRCSTRLVYEINENGKNGFQSRGVRLGALVHRKRETFAESDRRGRWRGVATRFHRTPPPSWCTSAPTAFGSPGGTLVNDPAARREPPYARIAADIRARIESGELRPGDRVPSTREITRRWGVAMATATRALAVLRDEGLILPRRGVGSVVRETGDPRRRGSGPRPRRPRPRGAETGLSPAAIVRAAIGVADAEGIDGLSMRRVAARLGVTTMALYRYVSAKDDLVLLMADTVFAEHALPDPPGNWRDGLELAARSHW